MKRLLVILLALIYITTTSGIVISTHYCMGEVADVAFGQKEADTCGTCGMDNKGCCHDDLDVIKLTDNHHVAFQSTELPSLEPIVIAHSASEKRFVALRSVPGGINNHSPPLNCSRNTLYCVFRI
jgi:hypothetical protein